MSLTLLVSQEKWQEFDQAWNVLIERSEPVDDLLEALRLVGEKKRLPRCLALVREHASALGKSGRPAEAARLLGTALLGGAAPGEISDALIGHAQAAWGTELWWPHYTQISGLRLDAADVRQAWSSFERLLWYGQGKLVFHPGGWGVGEVTELDVSAMELALRFQNGKHDRFPLTAAIDIFEPLAEQDLRAQHFRDPDALRKRMKEEPLEVLRAVVVRHGGKASSTSIKNALLQVGIEGSSWSGWWRKARKQAETSEWFKVTGTQLKGEIHLLHVATDPVEDLRRALLNLPTLKDLLARVRDQLVGTKDERMRNMMLEVLEQRLGESRAAGPVMLAAWMLVRDERGVTPAPLAELMRKAAAEPAPTDPSKAPPLWAMFQTLIGSREQERSVQALQDVYGVAWIDESIKHLQHAPGGMARALVDALYAEGRKQELATHYSELLARPLRAPDVLLALARLGEAGKLPGEFVAPIQRSQAYLQLATYLFVNRRGDAAHERTQTRLMEFLTKGKDCLLRRLLVGADYPTLQSMQRTLQRGVDEEIETVFLDLVTRAAPAIVRGEEPQFWENGRIWSTKAGLERRRAEFRHLMEVKIPANQDAIGRAAALGDLSENSEWEAAIEDQRNLTGRASEMEIELRAVDLIEDGILSENMVSPGTIVKYLDNASGASNEITILGPWDTDQDEHVVSYRAPLAAGLLGKRVGDTARIQLPGSVVEVTVSTIKPFDLA